jgi:hypothetical protein
MRKNKDGTCERIKMATKDYHKVPKLRDGRGVGKKSEPLTSIIEMKERYKEARL